MTDSISIAITDYRARLIAARNHLLEVISQMGAAEAGLTAYLKSFVSATRGVFLSAHAELAKAGPVSDGAAALLATSETLAEVGRNTFQVLANQAAITDLDRGAYARVGALYNDALCTLRNAWSQYRQVADYSAVRGASNCSSTGGGDPPSIHGNVNVMDKIAEANLASASILISSRALSEIQTWRADPLAHTVGAASAVPRSLYLISQGVSVAA